MKIFLTFAFGLTISFVAQTALAQDLKFVERDAAIATKNNESLYLYEGHSAKDSTIACWTMLQIQNDENKKTLVGTFNNLFDYSKSSLANAKLRSKVKGNSDNGQILFLVNQDSYSSQFNFDSAGALSSYVLNTRIAKIKLLSYWINFETHDEYHNLTCTNLQNVVDVKNASSEIQNRIQLDIENFQR